MPLWRRIQAKLWKVERKLTDGLSFSAEIRDLCDLLNRKIEQIEEERTTTVVSHPGGFYRELHRRRLSIAESYVRIARELESDHYEERLSSLRNLIRQSFHAKTIRLPLNTARVQINLIKEAIKNRSNRRRQLELLSDFSLASYGEERVIRRLCKKFYLVEVPDVGKPLKELNMGWDFHVHDNLSEGRKTPSQVLLDAFIKGISEVVLAYYTFKDEKIIKEAYEAAKILGIKVQIGMEFSVGPRWDRRHYMYIPPYFEEVGDLIDFIKAHEKVLTFLFAGLNENAERRKQTVSKILEAFNQEHLPKINEGYSPGSPEFCQPIRWSDLEAIVLDGQASRIHLGELLFLKLKSIFYKRVLFEKAQYELARYRYLRKELSGLEFNIVKTRYQKVREDYTSLSPVALGQKYIDGGTREDYDSFFKSEEEILPILAGIEGSVVYIHPLEAGLEKAIQTILGHHRGISHVESFNMQDSFKRNPNDLRLFNTFISALNTGNPQELKANLKQLDIALPDEHAAEQALSHYQKKPLIPLCGSDSTGRDPTIPGMGFISPGRIPKKMRRSYEKSHYTLPLPISKLILKYLRNGSPTGEVPGDTILSMGKTVEAFYNPVGDEEESERPGIARIWRYLNPFLKMVIRVGVSFPFAYFTIGLGYALVWFGITFVRNVLVDLVSAKGADPRDWSVGDVNFENTTQSLFWTGFSVPLLTFVKVRVEDVFLFTHLANNLAQQVIRFFAICFTNGAYIAAHNRLRRFDEKVIKANFFRSVLAWPPATLFSFLGDFITVPSVVQAKFWSDFVASLIEGTGKSSKQVHLRRRDLVEILPQLFSEDRKERTTSMLDTLYIWGKRTKGKASLRQVLQSREPSAEPLTAGATIADSETRKESPVHTGADYATKLKELFLADGVFLYLVEFINREFDGKNAYTMNTLVATYYPRFCDWIKNIPPERSTRQPAS